MGLRLYNEEDIQSIASAIRAKNGLSTLYSIQDMAIEVENLASSKADDYYDYLLNDNPKISGLFGSISIIRDYT